MGVAGGRGLPAVNTGPGDAGGVQLVPNDVEQALPLRHYDTEGTERGEDMASCFSI